MSKEQENIKCISSLVVFRKMYEQQQSVYDIISEFAKSIIATRNLQTFTLFEIHSYLKQDFGLQIVPAVMKTALKKLEFLSLQQGTYTIKAQTAQQNLKRISGQIETSRSIVGHILDEYLNYYHTKKPNSENDNDAIKENFCRSIIKEDFENDAEIISGFIVDNNNNQEFNEACKVIREGLIIYNGLSYTSEGTLVDKIDYPLTLFLETEILFHAVGYNGPLHLSLFNDFFQLVLEVNQFATKKNKKKPIKLCYFSETRKEVERYFSQAERILKEQKSINRSKPAMAAILNGAASIADVKQKGISFWRKISDMGIIEDDTPFDPTNEYYAKYNLSDKTDIAGTDEDNQKAYDIGQMMSKVNYLRRNSNRKVFRSVGAIILTGNHQTLKLGMSKVKQQEVPLSATLSYLTNRFWFSLHKGIFRNNEKIPGSDILTMAQVAFSQRVNESLISAYKGVREQFQKGEIDKKKANEYIAGLSVQFINPEDVTKEVVDCDDYFDLFDGNAIEKAKAERDLERQRHREEVAIKDKMINDKDHIVESMLEKKHRDEKKQYKTDVIDYNSKKSDYIKKGMREKCICSTTIVSIYLLLFIFSVIFSLKLNPNNSNILNLKVIIGSLLPSVATYIFPFTNKMIKKSFCWLFNKKIRKITILNILKEYKSKNPRPKLSLSKVEDYM